MTKKTGIDIILDNMQDKQQTKFNTDSKMIKNDYKFKIDRPTIDFSQLILCPFCLNANTYSKFVKDRAWITCPNCKELLTVKTALTIIKMNPEEYAKWVFIYRHSGFFQKIDFKKWNQKLKEIGINIEFWEVYKRLKGEEQAEDPDYIDKERMKNDYGIE
jgi:hypothetical protein